MFVCFRGSYVGKWFEIRFNETIVLNSIFLTMDGNNHIKQFGLRVPYMVKDNPDYKYYDIGSHLVFPTNASVLENPIKKIVRLNNPVVVDR